MGAASLGGMAWMGGGATRACVPPSFCVPTVLYPGCPIEHILEQISRTGATGVDVWDTGSAGPANPMQWVATHGPEALARRAGRFGLRIRAFSLFWTPGADLAGRLEWLRDAGGRLVVLNGGGAPGRPPWEALRPLEWVVEAAAARDLEVAIVNHRGTSLCSVQSIRQFTGACGWPRLGLALAPHHLAGGDTIEDAIAAAGDRLRLRYVVDGAGDALDRMHPDTEICLFTRERMPARQMTRALTWARERLTTA